MSEVTDLTTSMIFEDLIDINQMLLLDKEKRFYVPLYILKHIANSDDATVIKSDHLIFQTERSWNYGSRFVTFGVDLLKNLPIAIKVIKEVEPNTGLDFNPAQSLDEELKILDIIGTHPNIVSTLGCYVVDARLLGSKHNLILQIMDYAGSSLNTLDFTQIDELKNFIEQIISALQYTNSLECYYLDSKPANFLFDPLSNLYKIADTNSFYYFYVSTNILRSALYSPLSYLVMNQRSIEAEQVYNMGMSILELCHHVSTRGKVLRQYLNSSGKRDSNSSFRNTVPELAPFLTNLGYTRFPRKLLRVLDKATQPYETRRHSSLEDLKYALVDVLNKL